MVKHPPYTVHCDVPDCPETFVGQPWQGMPVTRGAARSAGWASKLVRHNESTGGFGTRRYDDLCPTHAELITTWNPKGRRKRK